MSQPSNFKPYDPSQDASYGNIRPESIKHVEIFPPIGISRLGDSKDEYFYCPEVPGRADHPFGKFRDGKQKIKRQVRTICFTNDNNDKEVGS
jgi:hypothetical protein